MACRGAMVRYIILNRVKSPEELKQFQGEAQDTFLSDMQSILWGEQVVISTGNDGEWSFEASKSSDTEFVFVRGAPADPKAGKRVAKGGKEDAAEASNGRAPQKKKRKTT